MRIKRSLWTREYRIHSPVRTPLSRRILWGQLVWVLTVFNLRVAAIPRKRVSFAFGFYRALTMTVNKDQISRDSEVKDHVCVPFTHCRVLLSVTSLQAAGNAFAATVSSHRGPDSQGHGENSQGMVKTRGTQTPRRGRSRPALDSARVSQRRNCVALTFYSMNRRNTTHLSTL